MFDEHRSRETAQLALTTETWERIVKYRDSELTAVQRVTFGAGPGLGVMRTFAVLERGTNLAFDEGRLPLHARGTACTPSEPSSQVGLRRGQGRRWR